MENLAALDQKHFIHPTSSIQEQQVSGPKAIFSRGEGIYLFDRDGNKYIDAMSSLWNVNIGHGRGEIAAVAKEQMEKLAYSSAFATFSHEPAIRLAAKLASLAPGDLNAVFFTSGGSESNDTAIKLIRHYWKLQGKAKKKKIITLKRAYHGVAAASTSATGIPEFWEMAGHLTTGNIHVANPYMSTATQAITNLQETIETEGAENIAAFMIEPVQGSGGVLIPPDDYLRDVRRVCKDNDILFVADEVITGFGRTGKMFGVQNWGIQPDVMTFAKGVTSGYLPLGGVMVSDKIHEIFKEKSTGTLFHGFTYSGHPTATAIALKNIEIIEREHLIQHAQKMGELLLKGLQTIRGKLAIVGDVRGIGLLAALELVADKAANKRFDPEKRLRLR
ncbi:aspartate aminotransferase family protein [Virgibacillus sp. 179-BFC.A HS]|uniref:Aspartate aminotransferase family protein n=1 Tax=Tigheibacillus jepli TaxID=3035914 RepID=A0ABU5CF79_9BACI|nr:aspartate aminotransferase family protein [Virgibacillus sp. 179-BFC.A HS]MDY0404989.1 aspartate aminotransferase family protein [Virgibacillus sp. 179-BFC.A HS]